MVRKGPLPEDLDVDYLVATELERLRRLAFETEAEEYLDAQRSERIAALKYSTEQRLERITLRDAAKRLERRQREAEEAWCREHGIRPKK